MYLHFIDCNGKLVSFVVKCWKLCDCISEIYIKSSSVYIRSKNELTCKYWIHLNFCWNEYIQNVSGGKVQLRELIIELNIGKEFI